MTTKTTKARPRTAAQALENAQADFRKRIRENLLGQALEEVRRVTGHRAVLEHRFHPVRLWRFDAAWPDILLALEMDGGVFRVKGGKPCPVCGQSQQGRHTSGAGFREDLDKFNAAASLGWRVVRFLWDDLERDQMGFPGKIVEIMQGIYSPLTKRERALALCKRL